MIDTTAIKQRFDAVSPFLDERVRRLVAAAEAQAAGWGGVTAVSLATGVARSPIDRHLKDLPGESALPKGRIRRQGGGHTATAAKDPRLLEDLKRLVDSTTRNDPENTLLWTSKNLRKLAESPSGDFM